MSQTYLLEIGTEELPAAHIPEAQHRLTNLFREELEKQMLSFDEIKTFATPRRLALTITGLPEKQPTVEKKVRGPKYVAAFESDGTAKKPALGFAKKNNMDVSELEKEEVGGTEYVVANLTVEGKPTSELLAHFVPDAINHISGERLMRWGDYEFKFSRPIRWIVSLLETEIVPFQISNVEVGRHSFGHRILAPEKIELKQPQEYVESLRKSKVMVDQDERRSLILKQVESLSSKSGGLPGRLDTDLLEEVVNITEWPYAVLGEFSDEYLKLPDALLETIMVHHQRYFPVQKEKLDSSDSIETNNLLPYFITVANNDLADAQNTIKQGNERVLRARLADGKFFYFDDQKKKLEDRVNDLDQLTYQHGLGSYLAKRDRLVELAKFVAKEQKLDSKLSLCLERAMQLCKLDLVTNLVGELPELQGYVGAWYSAHEKEPPEVAKAIASHYAPRHTDDSIPQDEIGMWASVLDKIDHLTGLFALGKRPTGSSDPFALRRNAQGLVDILLDGLSEYQVDLTVLIDHLLDKFEPMLANRKKGFNRAAIKSELEDFIVQRLRGKLMDLGNGREIVDCVLIGGEPLKEISTVKERCQVVDHLLSSDSGIALARAGVRVANILKPDSCKEVVEADLSTDVEKELWTAYKNEVAKKIEAKQALSEPKIFEEYKEMIETLTPLTDKIDQFFDGVMVNDEDSKKRNLRHAILSNIDKHYKKIGQFKPLQPLLP